MQTTIQGAPRASRSAEDGRAATAPLPRLRRWNALAGAFHLSQAALLVWLSNDFALPVTGPFLDQDPATVSRPPAPEVLFDLRIGWAVASFSALSAFAHFAVAGPLRRRYEAWLARGQNPYRWVEYSLSASVMIVVIAMLTGIFSVAALLALFAVNASMILFGLLMERHNEGRSRPDWLPFWFGSLAGVVPWVAIGIHLAGGSPPGFVYGIFVSLFALFNVFAVVMWLRYRGVGRFADPLHGERAYILLSFTAKSALAWQVFAGTLR